MILEQGLYCTTPHHSQKMNELSQNLKINWITYFRRKGLQNSLFNTRTVSNMYLRYCYLKGIGDSIKFLTR